MVGILQTRIEADFALIRTKIVLLAPSDVDYD
jgi:hypothetical protein